MIGKGGRLNARPRLGKIGLSLLLAQTIWGCQGRSPEPPPAPAAPSPIAPAPAPSASFTPVLAVLEGMKRQVTFRRSRELVWGDAKNGMDFFPFDSVQTHEKATATVKLLEGSRLELSERTLIILHPERTREKQEPVDQAVFRRGSVQASAQQRELWLITSAALLRLRSKNGKEPARAKVSIEEGKKLTVKLDSGVGSAVRQTGEGKLEAVALSTSRPLNLSAPKAAEEFDGADPKTRWWEQAPLPPEPSPRAEPVPVVRETPKAAQASPEPVPAVELELEGPKEQSETTAETTEIRGRAGGKGGRVKINGKAVKLAADGGFVVKQELRMGTNVILIQLIRPDGTSSYKRLKILRR